MMFDVNRNPSTGEIRRFGVTVGIAFAVLAGVFAIFRLRQDAGEASAAGWVLPGVLLMVAVCIGVVCRVSPTVGRRVYIVWMSGSVLMARVMTPVVFSVMFVVLLPVFSLIRLGDPLRKRRTHCASFWEPHRPYEATMERMRRAF